MMIDQLIERSRAYDENKIDFGPYPAADWGFAVGVSGLQMYHTEVAAGLPLLDHAFNQVCGRLGAAAWPGSSRSLPVDYLRACPSHIQASQFNYWANILPENREWFVRTYNDQVRAVLTDRYSVVDCTQVLEWLQQITEEQNLTPTYFRPHLTPDLLHLRTIFRTVTTGVDWLDNAPWGIGVYVSTGEIGNRRVEVSPMVQNNRCTNSIWMRHKGHWSHSHTGSERALRSAFLVHLLEALEASEQIMERLLLAERQNLPTFDKILDGMCELHGWSQAVRDNVIRGSGTHNPTVYSLTMGITYAAQMLDAEGQDEMEAIAGEFLHHMTSQREKAHVRA